MEVNRVAFILHETGSCWQGLRCLFGCLAENIWCGAFVIDCALEPPSSMPEEEFNEHLESFVEDMEAELYTNVPANAERFKHIQYLPLKDMIPKIKTYELVIPFA